MDNHPIVLGLSPANDGTGLFGVGRCDLVRRDLGGYVDGELGGADVLRVGRHLAVCRACADEAEAFRAIGETLRQMGQTDRRWPAIDGLADGVVSRIRAESDWSWPARLARMFDDVHWVLVGAGSLTATFATTVLLSVVLVFGPAPERADSLSGLLTSLGSPPGPMFLYASAMGDDGDGPVLMQVENGWPEVSPVTAALAVSSSYPGSEDADLVSELASLVTRDGRAVRLDAMHPDDRRKTEALLDQLRRIPTQPYLLVGSGIEVHEVRLVTSTGVTAKRL